MAQLALGVTADTVCDMLRHLGDESVHRRRQAARILLQRVAQVDQGSIAEGGHRIGAADLRAEGHQLVADLPDWSNVASIGAGAPAV